MVLTRITWLHRGSTSFSPTAIKGNVGKVLFLQVGALVDVLTDRQADREFLGYPGGELPLGVMNSSRSTRPRVRKV